MAVRRTAAHFSDRFKGYSISVSHLNSHFEASLQFGKVLGRQLKARGLQYTHHYTEKFMAADSASGSMPKQVSIATIS